MKNLSRWFMLAMLVAAFGLFGCEGDDGEDGEDFQLPQGEYVGLSNCATCHGGSVVAEQYAESAHLNQGDHTIDSCSIACHNPLGDAADSNAAFGVSSPSVVGCESCHGPGSGHVGVGEIPIPEPDSAVCGQCHDAEGELAHITHHPFNEQIYTRFELSGHGSAHAREAFCSACHSHEGALQFINMGGAEDVIDLAESYNPTTVNTWEQTEEELSELQCSTCHNPHSADLRVDDTIAAVTADHDDDATTDDTTEDMVVYSAEFNLCTTCHMVDLTYEPAGHGDAGVLLDYQLTADSYSAANMVDAATGTFAEETFEIFNADGTVRDRTVYETQVFYHDNTPGGGRSFIDTHFAGNVVGRLAAVDETDPAAAVTDVMVTGYNVNAANPDACTVCHDPHSANKVQGESVEQAVAFGEGVGMFHADYLGDAQAHGCQPCHNGQESFVTWVVGGSEPDARVTDVIACRTCHTLETLGENADGETILGDPTGVREFAADHVFEFNSGAVADVADLGANQICFECHKGRTPAPADETTIPAGETQIREYAYLHYAPSMAILFGVESEMVPLYGAPADYAGKFTHGGGAVDGVAAADFGCTTCHNVHQVGEAGITVDKIITSPDCAGCHGSGAFVDAEVLKARTVEYGAELLGTVLDVALATGGLDAQLDADLTAAADRAAQLEVMDLYIHGRTNSMPTNALAKAADVYKIFNYEDGSPHGVTHGHGGSWAHNSRFARQVQYDAIEALGDPNGVLTANGGTLTRP